MPRPHTKTKQSGFTLIELMITLAIIAVLATMAMPVYQNYMNQARFSSVINATEPVKTALEICMQSHSVDELEDSSDDNPCMTATDSYNVSENTDENSQLNSLTISHDTNAYTVTADAKDLTTDDNQPVNYILTGTFDEDTGIVSWQRTGTCVELGWC
ncbi:prepilin-type N-terminal cleavage/methylation domain-containing protein [Celerinatantimonas sp. MCCC 1A17872]|uniref:pilin n=1 Tax=Celerinatantimonas sp. MCCC 1A17872 TaxID=3177514 RepID=UPI0038CB2237